MNNRTGSRKRGPGTKAAGAAKSKGGSRSRERRPKQLRGAAASSHARKQLERELRENNFPFLLGADGMQLAFLGGRREIGKIEKVVLNGAVELHLGKRARLDAQGEVVESISGMRIVRVKTDAQPDCNRVTSTHDFTVLADGEEVQVRLSSGSP